MDPNEPGEAATPPDPNSGPERNLDADAPGNEEREPTSLTVNVSRAEAPDESVSVNLGQPARPDEPESRIQIRLDLLKETRVRMTVESLPPDLEPAESESQGDSKVVIETRGDGSDPVISLQPTASSVSFRTRIVSALQRWPYSLEIVLFGLALLVYLSTHLVTGHGVPGKLARGRARLIGIHHWPLSERLCLLHSACLLYKLSHISFVTSILW